MTSAGGAGGTNNTNNPTPLNTQFNASGATNQNDAQQANNRAKTTKDPNAKGEVNRDPSLISPTAANISKNLFEASQNTAAARTAQVNNALANIPEHVGDSTLDGLKFLASAAAGNNGGNVEDFKELEDYGLLGSDDEDEDNPLFSPTATRFGQAVALSFGPVEG
jgi:hypothetical protein